MPQQAVNVLISPDGTVEVSVEGMKGPACLQATEALETALGATSERKRTDTGYVTQQQTQAATQKG